ncbi:hypothetical protein [Micromonospora sp. C28ISP2-4]|uniref:hypothetical protein n=1 Tax=Micromonospora sp. C28ISP2-4 TaxID=3059523 RepID=UPI00267730DF|nr:hypothetical protein [Micromonospora sp. C28ISP2-4]MDO3685438.1 hypothetical protein [Micromonospora sp. C28ISP2-4]
MPRDEPAGPGAVPPGPVRRFPFRFDPAFRLPLALIGVRPATAWLDWGPDALVVRFGPWLLRTTPGNVTGAELSGPYRWWRAIGPHLSAADGGVTFGAGLAGGVCLRFAEPVPALLPGPWLRHPAVTVTVADPAAVRDAVVRGPDL